MSVENKSKKSVKVIQTARDTGDRLTQKDDVYFEKATSDIERFLINVYEDVTFQEIEGFGGAFTEAASTTLDKMSPDKRAEILNAYFNPKTGLGYNMCRTHINSCDFSLGNYAYTEVEGDVNLEHFTIERDRKSLIPFIKDAMAVEGADFRLFASPWSPPAWMKTTGEMNHGGKIKDEYREAWAKYYARYIKEYDSEGIKIWGLTVQNEPIAVQRWDSCIYTAEEERDFVRDYLGPTLEKEGLGDVKLMIWDQNKERIYERAKIALTDPEAAKYIWGVAFHWYSGDHFEALSAVNRMFPDIKMMLTEACQERSKPTDMWTAAEKYGHDIIGNLNNWACGWVDWNLLLNVMGGPNHVGNYCDAPIIADTEKNEVIYNGSYYYMGHFSKYIRPGAKRIASTKYTDKIETTAFLNTDGRIAVVVLNKSDEEVFFRLRYHDERVPLKSLPHSIMTLVFDA
ncbi:MAG: O-Glycosyl hydrolase family 30 [Firmicutes bacterium ADurb.Bin193]|nr:MAG: O-Glycosyl hydrolase family 30 [Firmicutes bacterium ADurb.Bin193]